jgi:hypothetical protein
MIGGNGVLIFEAVAEVHYTSAAQADQQVTEVTKQGEASAWNPSGRAAAIRVKALIQKPVSLLIHAQFGL